MKSENFLFISDLQIPFENSKALEFCLYLRKYFKIPDERIYCVGDEVDQLLGSLYKKNPNWRISAVEEIELTIDRLQAWYKAFPHMKLAISNHGVRWRKKAIEGEIPDLLLKRWSEVVKAPRTWIWQDQWTIKTQKKPIVMVHGCGYSGPFGHRQAAIDQGANTIIGHLHAGAGVNFINTSNMSIWGMNVGSLISPSAIAFEYGKHSRFKPVLGTGIVVDSNTPLIIPLT